MMLFLVTSYAIDNSNSKLQVVIVDSRSAAFEIFGKVQNMFLCNILKINH